MKTFLSLTIHIIIPRRSHIHSPNKKTACATAACSKSPHSRTVKRTTSGSSSSPLSCSWYDLPLPSLTHNILTQTFHLSPGLVPAIQPPLSLLPARLRAHLLLVAPAPLDAHLALWPAHHNRAVPSLCACRLLLGAHGHVARGGKRPRRMCGGPRRVVHP